jgi:hypothetical protein
MFDCDSLTEMVFGYVKRNGRPQMGLTIECDISPISYFEQDVS